MPFGPYLVDRALGTPRNLMVSLRWRGQHVIILINERVFYDPSQLAECFHSTFASKRHYFTRAWLNFFTLTFRALGRNHIASTPLSGHRNAMF